MTSVSYIFVLSHCVRLIAQFIMAAIAVDHRAALVAKRTMTSVMAMEIAENPEMEFGVMGPGVPYRDSQVWRRLFIEFNRHGDAHRQACYQCAGLYSMWSRGNTAKYFHTASHCLQLTRSYLLSVERAFYLEYRVPAYDVLENHMGPAVLVATTLHHWPDLQAEASTRLLDQNVRDRVEMFNGMVEMLGREDPVVLNVIKAKNGVAIDQDIASPVILDFSKNSSSERRKHPHSFLYVGYRYDDDQPNNTAYVQSIPAVHARVPLRQAVNTICNVAGRLITRLGSLLNSKEFCCLVRLYFHVSVAVKIVNNRLTIHSADICVDTYRTAPGLFRQFCVALFGRIDPTRLFVNSTLLDIRRMNVAGFGAVNVKKIHQIREGFDHVYGDARADLYNYDQTCEDAFTEVFERLAERGIVGSVEEFVESGGRGVSWSANGIRIEGDQDQV